MTLKANSGNIADREAGASPRITIITSTYNCAETLKSTARSIRQQTYKNVQWIIADGGSVDGTLAVIRENGDVVSAWFSGPDAGIYDAWNKASPLIDGDWVLFLGAGDALASEHILARMAEFAGKQDASVVVVYGNVLMRNVDGVDRYLDRKPRLNFWEFGRPALPHHQGVFHRRRLFAAQNAFDSTYKIAGDSKFLLAAAKQGKFAHFDMTVATMSDDGASNDYRNIFITKREIHRLCDEMGIEVPFLRRLGSDLRWVLSYGAHAILPARLRRILKGMADALRPQSK
jgi:glycosyltransferase involved in cell wall biosynthesis